MNIPREVISDLLPLYLAGEASAGTRALLEEYLRQNPEFAAQVRDHAEKSAGSLRNVVVSLPPDLETATLEHVRRFNRYRQLLLAFAIAFSLIPFTFVFENSHVRWIMDLKQAPFFWVAALGCWIAYYILGRRLRSAE